MPNATTNAIFDNIRAQLPGVNNDIIGLELFNTVDEMARDALNAAPPTDVDADPATWLGSTLWVPNYQPLLEGTLARLYGQLGKPYSSGEMAKAHLDRYMVLLQLARSDAVSTPSTVYQRLINALRVQLPMARESAVLLAAFSIANKIRFEALRLAPLADANTTPSGWLPTEQWDNAYQAMFYGTLANMQMQTAQPWTNPTAAGANHGLFLEELMLLRGEQASAVSRGMTKLMDLARVRLPGARDNIIQLELFAVLNEFFQDSNCWYEDIDFAVSPASTEYYIIPTSVSSAVRMLGLVNSDQRAQRGVFDLPGTVTLYNTPNQADTFTVRIGLTVADPVTRDGYPEFPTWVLDKYANDLLDGLLGRMMSEIAKPYTNERLAIYHMRKFQTSIAKAKVEASHRNVYRGQSWQFPQAFAARRWR